MKASSVKIRSFSCFKNNWAGFDEFKPITLIIGRNNTGKSHLLDLVELLTERTLVNIASEYDVSCTGQLDEDFLTVPFSKTKSGGEIGPSYMGFHEEHSHWNEIGKHYEGLDVSWKPGSVAEGTFEIASPPRQVRGQFRTRALDAIQMHLQRVESPISQTQFRRILADRDFKPEAAANELNLHFAGVGATNIIRRHITSSSHPEDLIQVDLLAALDTIFGGDGNFQRIEIRQHDEPVQNPQADKLWEVFLGEPSKGLIPLSSSGSGLKTVMLVLLNLLVIPSIEKKERSQFVYAFEELENNLHPALLRRLLKYLTEYVAKEKCRLYLTTHSSVALDYLSTRNDTQIIHVTHDGDSATSTSISTHFDHVGLLTELGSRPSDLLQANGVLWLEGPSDRIYFNRFIELFSGGEIREGRDYQCAFYGGANLATSTFCAPEESDETFTNLLRLNHNIAVICDGDRTAESGTGSRIKGRVQRIKREVERISSAFLWITEAKEIENYVPGSVWSQVYGQDGVPDPGAYDRFPSSHLKGTDFVPKCLRRKSFDKCQFAMKAAPLLTREALATRFEFESKITELITNIRTWNN